MPIRNAEQKDIPMLVEGGSRIHALTRFKHFPFSAQKTAESLAAIIRHDKGRYAFFVAENSEKKIVGALIGVMEQQLFSEVHVASLMHLDVLPEARMGGHAIRLIKAFEIWANNRKAVEITFGTSGGTDAERMSTALIKLGFQQVGSNFAKLLVKEL
jgi:GNAT superfamily N-acetyltransferase